MTFGLSLRQARERRGWSRFRLTLVYKETSDGTITETAIKCIETGRTENPRGTTIAVLSLIFPELTQTTPNP
jgi:hypothetical protein